MPWVSRSSVVSLRFFLLLSVFMCLHASSKVNSPSDQVPVPADVKVDFSVPNKDLDQDQKDAHIAGLSQRVVNPFALDSGGGGGVGVRSAFRYPVDIPEKASLPELSYVQYCSDAMIACRNLSAHCLICDVDGVERKPDCLYGQPTSYTCKIRPGVRCEGTSQFSFVAKCRYCYQTEPFEHSCIAPTNCKVSADPLQRLRTNCSVNHDVICIGRRRFFKMDACNHSTGYRWSIAMLLSITVGGFGADRFYLGQWREGIGKLFSFGGLGIWTIVDIILIGVGYLRPDDGSLYIDL